MRSYRSGPTRDRAASSPFAASAPGGLTRCFSYHASMSSSFWMFASGNKLFTVSCVGGMGTSFLTPSKSGTMPRTRWSLAIHSLNCVTYFQTLSYFVWKRWAPYLEHRMPASSK